jgi:hypothetical protein
VSVWMLVLLWMFLDSFFFRILMNPFPFFISIFSDELTFWILVLVLCLILLFLFSSIKIIFLQLYPWNLLYPRFSLIFLVSFLVLYHHCHHFDIRLLNYEVFLILLLHSLELLLLLIFLAGEFMHVLPCDFSFFLNA